MKLFRLALTLAALALALADAYDGDHVSAACWSTAAAIWLYLALTTKERR